MARRWQRAAAAGQRVCGDLGRQLWQSGKGPQTGFVSWWAVLRARFETLYKWSMATWPGAGKGLLLQGNVFAVTWEGSGKAVKAHTGVLCPDGPCFAQVVKPSKWMEWSMAIWRHGQALAKGCRCRATCSRWPGEAVARRYMDYGDMARHWHRAAAAGQRVCGDLGRQRQSGKGRQTGFVSWWAVLRARFETLYMEYGD